VWAALLASALAGWTATAAAASPYSVTPPDEVLRATPAYRYGNLSNQEAFAELDRRGIAYERVVRVPGVRAPIRLAGPLHGVDIHSSLPAEERAESIFEILDARLALALDDFSALLEEHDIVELVHYTMYRPNVAKPEPESESEPREQKGSLQAKDGLKERHAGKGKGKDGDESDKVAAPAPSDGKASKASAKKATKPKKPAASKAKPRATKASAKAKGKKGKKGKPAAKQPTAAKAPATTADGPEGKPGEITSDQAEALEPRDSPPSEPSFEPPAAKGVPLYDHPHAAAKPVEQPVDEATAAAPADAPSEQRPAANPRAKKADKDKKLRARARHEAEPTPASTKASKTAKTKKTAPRKDKTQPATGADHAAQKAPREEHASATPSRIGQVAVEEIHALEPEETKRMLWAPPGTRHPAGLAIDVGGLRKSDGRWLSVADHFGGKIGSATCGASAKQPASNEGRELWSLVCEANERGLFTYVLTPNYNAAHADHFHMELKPASKVVLFQ
jgi:hypothetical protein